MWVSAIGGVLMVVGAVALNGCSSPSPSGGGGSAGNSASVAGTASGGAASGVGGANSGGSSSGGQAAAGSSTSGGANDSAHFGQVVLQSLIGGTARVSVSARFVSGSGPGPTTTCSQMTDGPCRASLCDEAPLDVAGSIFASAGTLTVTSTEVTGTATLEPDAKGEYPTSSEMVFAKEFLGGERVQIKAAGAAVPAFADELSVPLVLLLSQPLFVKGQGSVDAPRSQDLSLVWTRGVQGVVLYITGTALRADGMPGRAHLTCQVPSETGSFVVKSSLLQPFAADTRLNVLTVGTKVITAGDYSITLATTLPVANPDKDLIPILLLK